MKALIVVDTQVDFCEGGALGVAGGNDVAFNVARFIREHREDYRLVLFTADMHEPWPNDNGGHFSADPDFVNTWPVHCVINTAGAELHDAIKPVVEVAMYDVFAKGTGRPDYSGFQGKNYFGHSLDYALTFAHVDEVDIVGIAGDYCVKATAFDAKRLGYEVNILSDMVASVGGSDATFKAKAEVDSYAGPLLD